MSLLASSYSRCPNPPTTEPQKNISLIFGSRIVKNRQTHPNPKRTHPHGKTPTRKAACQLVCRLHEGHAFGTSQCQDPAIHYNPQSYHAVLTIDTHQAGTDDLTISLPERTLLQPLKSQIASAAGNEAWRPSLFEAEPEAAFEFRACRIWRAIPLEKSAQENRSCYSA